MIDLTPLEVRKKKSDFRRVMRGYDSPSVDDFLDLVADRMDELVRENVALQERASRQEQQVAEFRERERALTEALVTAQEMREEIRRQTTREAELARQSAEQEASRLRSTTELEVSRLRSTAEQETAALRRQAEEDVARLRSKAEREATQLRQSAAQEAAQLRSKAQTDATQLRSTAEREASELRSTVRQEREREEQALRHALTRQREFFAAYLQFLEEELVKVREAAGVFVVEESLSAGRATQPAGPRGAEPPDAGTLRHEPRPAGPEVSAPPVHGRPPADTAPALAGGVMGAAALGAVAGVAGGAAAGSPEAPETLDPLNAADLAHGDEERGDEQAGTLDIEDVLGRAAVPTSPPAGVEEPPFDPGILDAVAPEAGQPPQAVPGPMFPDDPIGDDELAFVDGLEVFDAPEPFAPEPFQPDTFEPDTFEPDTFEPDTFEPDTFEPVGAVLDEGPGDGPGPIDAGDDELGALGLPGAGAFDSASAWGDEGDDAAADAEPEDDLTLYDRIAAEPEAGVPGPVGLGSLDEPQGWATAPSWSIDGVELVRDATPSAELPILPGTGPDSWDDDGPATEAVGGQPQAGEIEGDSEEQHEDAAASEILRNAEAAGYSLPELDDLEELLLDDAVIEPADDADDEQGWLDSLLEDEK